MCVGCYCRTTKCIYHNVAAELIANGLFETVAGHALVFVANKFDLAVIALTENHVECAFVGAGTQFASTQQFGGITMGSFLINNTALVTGSRTQ